MKKNLIADLPKSNFKVTDKKIFKIRMALPLQYGGLGIGFLKQRNNALLLKWL